MKTKFAIFLLFLLFLSISVVSAHDDNATDSIQVYDEVLGAEITDDADITGTHSNDILKNESGEIVKTTPTININSDKVDCKDTIEICLINSTGDNLTFKTLDVTLNKEHYSITTNSYGIGKLKINLAANTYKLTISFDGDEYYNSVSKTFDIKVSKLKTKITEAANFVVRGNNLYFYLVDSNGNAVSGKKVAIKFKGKKYVKKTDSNGRVGLKIKNPNSRYSIQLKYGGDNQYMPSSKKLKFHVTNSKSIKIGNSKLLTNGYLRVYLKVAGRAVSKKVTLFIGNKKLSKKTNSEGIVVFKPEVNAGHYTVKAQVGKYYSAKNIKCYEGDIKDPLNENITYNGKPDIDVMPGNYVMGDENAKYVLKKSQYKEVLKRDSYCLFLNNKLTKYTFFKTKNHPNLNHIVKREKWNVIERAINAKIVKKNKNGYWPGTIAVSLKGKSYTYPEVRDVQNTGYTCGPASASVCSQVLKNFVCEKHISKLAGSKRGEGTSCPAMINALAKNNFVCTYFYKSTFNKALVELKKGGAALIFHANNHYVSIIDISGNGKMVLVSNSYGTYDNIPTKWVKVSFMKKKFSKQWDESLIVRLNYKLSDFTKNSINAYYNSFGSNWHKHNTHQSIANP
ncbi:hypothetical protein [Methanobrevibacter sp.]|uniref:hypothetical protein n=1 Tax=Methanobrevibacter sp. TaxID=66852 RepID=UPI0038669EC6